MSLNILQGSSEQYKTSHDGSKAKIIGSTMIFGNYSNAAQFMVKKLTKKKKKNIEGQNRRIPRGENHQNYSIYENDKHFSNKWPRNIGELYVETDEEDFSKKFRQFRNKFRNKRERVPQEDSEPSRYNEESIYQNDILTINPEGNSPTIDENGDIYGNVVFLRPLKEDDIYGNVIIHDTNGIDGTAPPDDIYSQSAFKLPPPPISSSELAYNRSNLSVTGSILQPTRANEMSVMHNERLEAWKTYIAQF